MTYLSTTANGIHQPPTNRGLFMVLFGVGVLLVLGSITGAAMQLMIGGNGGGGTSEKLTDAQLWANAFDAADQRDFASAREWSVQAEDQTLAPVLLWTELRSGQSTTSLVDIEGFIENNSNFPGIEVVEIARQSMVSQTLDDPALLAYYTDHPPVNFAAQLDLLKLQSRTGNSDQAIDTAREYWRTRTLRPADQAALRAEYGDSFTSNDHLARLDHLMTHGARNSGRRLIPLLPDTYQNLALEWADGGDGTNADIPATFRAHPMFAVPKAIAADEAGDTQAAIGHLEGIPLSLRLPRFEWRARHILIRELMKQQRFDEAYRIALSHGLFLMDGERDDTVAEANWLAGWIALTRMGLTFSGQQSFEMAFEAAESANWQAQSAFWLAQTYASQRQTDRAQEMLSVCAALPHTYYGQLCTEQQDNALFGEALPLGQPSDDPATFGDGTQGNLLAIVNALVAAQRGNEASRFIYRLGGLAQDQDDIATLNQLAKQAGLERTALGLGWIAADRQLVELSAMLPTLDADLISPLSLEFALLHAVASRESVFQIDAKSPKGALGLMQVIPETGARMAADLGIEWDEARMTTDPGYNLTLGGAYMQSLVERFDNNLLLAIASYNAGPGNVDRWIAEFGDPSSDGVDAGIWVENIPFRETRNYVKDVVARYNLYRALLAGRPVNIFTPDYLSRI